MASPPEILGDSTPLIRVTRTAPPSEPATLRTWASLAPVTEESTERTTWLAAGSRAQEMPGTFSDRSMVALAWPSAAPLRVTYLGTAPAELTVLAPAELVTVTTSLPLALSR